MFKPRFVLRDFEGERNRILSGRYLRLCLDALVGINCYELADNPNLPGLYESGAVYVRDPKGVEDWQDCYEVCHRKQADCKSLASYRTAELRTRYNIAAIAQYRWKDRDDGGSLYHIQVQYPDLASARRMGVTSGLIEDPSARLGMATSHGSFT